MRIYKMNRGNEIIGACLEGIIKTTYGQLVEALGEPLEGTEDGKVRAQWILSFSGIIATIYDYKNSEPLEEVSEWCVGGKRNGKALYFVSELLGAEIVEAGK